MLARRKAEKARVAPCRIEAARIADHGHHGSAGEQPDARYGEQRLAGGARLGQFCQLALQLPDSCLEEADLLEHEPHRASEKLGQVTRYYRRPSNKYRASDRPSRCPRMQRSPDR
jgi:hypothetical protein